MNNTHPKRPLIIGGVHRSGTSLVRRIVNAHSHFYCGPEVKFFKDWHGDYVNDPIPHARFMASARAMLTESDLFEVLGQAFVDIHQRAARAAGKTRWADKNPENVLYLAEWERLLGDDWCFLQVVRNPLDTIASIREAKFRYAIPSNLEEIIEFYRRYTLAGLAWNEAHPDRSYQILYEKLTRSPGPAVGRLMAWLGEVAEPGQLQFNQFTHQPGLEDPKVQWTTGVHADSVGRWKTDLTRQDATFIMSKTVDLWRRLDVENIFPLSLAE
jgi:hypothetical protein